MSLAIGLAIVWGTRKLFQESLHLLFDGVPSQVNLHAVRACLGALPGVTAVNDVHIWAMSTSQIALTAHLVRPTAVDPDAFLAAAHTQLNDRFGITHVTLQVSERPAAAVLLVCKKAQPIEGAD